MLLFSSDTVSESDKKTRPCQAPEPGLECVDLCAVNGVSPLDELSDTFHLARGNRPLQEKRRSARPRTSSANAIATSSGAGNDLIFGARGKTV